MKVKDKAMNISFCCGTMGNDFLAGKFRLDEGLYFNTTANIKLNFCPFCGTEIEIDKCKPEPGHRGPDVHVP